MLHGTQPTRPQQPALRGHCGGFSPVSLSTVINCYPVRWIQRAGTIVRLTAVDGSALNDINEPSLTPASFGSKTVDRSVTKGCMAKSQLRGKLHTRVSDVGHYKQECVDAGDVALGMCHMARSNVLIRRAGMHSGVVMCRCR